MCHNNQVALSMKLCAQGIHWFSISVYIGHFG